MAERLSQPQPMSDERLAEIRRQVADPIGGPHPRRCGCTHCLLAALLADFDALSAENERLRGDLDWISDEATDAHFLPTINGAVPATVEGAMEEGRSLADALQRIGHRIYPDRWVAPAEPERAADVTPQPPADEWAVGDWFKVAQERFEALPRCTYQAESIEGEFLTLTDCYGMEWLIPFDAATRCEPPAGRATGVPEDPQPPRPFGPPSRKTENAVAAVVAETYERMVAERAAGVPEDEQPPAKPCELGLLGTCRREVAVEVWDGHQTCARCMAELRAMADENDAPCGVPEDERGGET